MFKECAWELGIGWDPKAIPAILAQNVMMLRSHHWYIVAHTICIISLSSSSILCNLMMASSGRNI